MLPRYDYDPAVHRIQEVPALKTLREKLSSLELFNHAAFEKKEIITYHHEVHKTWVVSILHKGRLLDLGLLASGDGGVPVATREIVDGIVQRVSTLIDAVEVRKRMQAKHRNDLRKDEEAQEELFVGYRKAYRQIKKKRGQVKADEFRDMTSHTAIRP